MSKKKNSGSYSSSARRTKGKGFAGLITAIVVLVVAVVLTVTAAFGSSGFTNPDFKTWFNSWGKGDTVGVGGDDVTECSVILTKEESDFMKLKISSISEDDYAAYNVPEGAEAAYTLTVNLTNDGMVQDETVLGIMDWKKDDYEWSFDKRVNDYAKFVQTEVGGHEFVLSALQPYGDPIVLEICLFENRDINCTVQLDYMRRFYTDYQEERSPDLYLSGWEDNALLKAFPHESFIETSRLTCGVGTITPDFVVVECLYKGSNVLNMSPMSTFNVAPFVSLVALPSYGDYEFNTEAYAANGYPKTQVEFFSVSNFLSSATPAERERFCKFFNYTTDCDGDSAFWFDVDVRIKTYYNGKLYGISDAQDFDFWISDTDQFVGMYEYDLPRLDPSTGNIIL